MGLARYVAVRAALIIPSVLILYTVAFIILRILPGNPILAVLGTKNIPPEQLAALEKQLGLDKPLYVQYFDYLWRALHGDFGQSLIVRGRPIAADLADRLPATIELAVAGLLVSLVLGLATGLVAGLRRDTKIDVAMRVYGALTYTLFIPWLGLLFQLVFAVWLHWLPVSGRIDPQVEVKTITGLYVLDSLLTGNWAALKSALAHIVLPALTLGIVLSGPYTRLLRNNLAVVLDSNFILAYRAHGVRERRITWHAFRNAIIPVVTYAGLQFALLLGGAVLTETTFDWPGIGTYLVDKIQYRDYPAIQAVILVFALIVGLISLIVDIIYAYIDPRIRY
ncbi:ABC transporter permease [Pyrofollis japonicus]|uniref:ABC transporter permease n=1 Tax=Pyrofollis japonicus TaxID=3060460 RepID=UPI00295A5B02|nr:ABC transporter permease [Pyrofollis japonicus]BEP17418.1 ABC transporter permease [Pyrofollis japonicus]